MSVACWIVPQAVHVHSSRPLLVSLAVPVVSMERLPQTVLEGIVACGSAAPLLAAGSAFRPLKEAHQRATEAVAASPQCYAINCTRVAPYRCRECARVAPYHPPACARHCEAIEIAAPGEAMGRVVYHPRLETKIACNRCINRLHLAWQNNRFRESWRVEVNYQQAFPEQRPVDMVALQT